MEKPKPDKNGLLHFKKVRYYLQDKYFVCKVDYYGGILVKEDIQRTNDGAPDYPYAEFESLQCRYLNNTDKNLYISFNSIDTNNYSQWVKKILAQIKYEFKEYIDENNGIMFNI